MAVKLATTIKVFLALSSDDWPTAPPEGSVLHIVDTGDEYIYFDGTWEQDLRRIAAIQAAGV